MKRITGSVLLVISFVALVCLLYVFPHNVRFDKLMVSGEQADLIKQNRMLSQYQLIEKLIFDGEELFFDKESGTFYYSLMEGDSTSYNPYVRMKASKNDVEILFYGSNITSESIRNNETIIITAYDKDCYEVYYLKCTTLPMMNIDSQAEIGEGNTYQIMMQLYDNRKGATQRLTTSAGTIHLRGSSTMVYPKKSYRLSLIQDSVGNNERNNDISLLGMRQDDDWILYPAYNDQEKVRNVFSTNLWKYTCASDNSLGIDNGTEYKYIELFMNGEYWGLYALGYPIDALQLSIDSSKGERLYKKNTWENEINLTMNRSADIEGYTTKYAGEDRWDALYKYYITLNREWDNPQSMYGGMDIDNSIDTALFINMIQGLDQVGVFGCMSFKNMYLSMKKSGEGYVILYTPWDLDITWGNKWTGDSDTNLTEPYGTSTSQNAILEHGNLEALIACYDEEIWNLILTKYRTLRQDLWSLDNMTKMLDEYEDDIYDSGAYRRDMERWPDGSYADPEDGLGTFKSYVAERLEKLDEYYDKVEQLIEKNNIYIIRSVQYEDFTSSQFICEINDRDVLSYDEEYADFIEYIGVDTDDIPENARYIVVDGASDMVEYYEAFDENGSYTCIGYINAYDNDENNGKCDIYVDGKLWYSSDREAKPNNVLTFMTEDGVYSFDFTKRYIMWADLITWKNPSEWHDIVKRNGYGVVVEITNHDIIGNESFKGLIEGFGISLDDITYDTDFIVINQDGDASVVDNGHGSGDRNATVLGEISVFYNDNGGYGVYIDGSECILVNEPDNSDNIDIRISVVNTDTEELIWSSDYNYSKK